MLKRTAFKGEPATFVMELPAYRIPTPRNMFLHMWDKAWDFIQRAFTIIFVASVVIWVLQTFSWSFTMVDQASHSILASIGSLLAPLDVYKRQELDMPMVIALNMMDEVKENGDSIDVKALESALGLSLIHI